MAKKSTAAAVKGGGMKNFEERLKRLEELGSEIRRSDIPLDEALKAFEEGIKLAKTLEKDLEKIENRIEILINSGDAPQDGAQWDEEPELELFSGN